MDDEPARGVDTRFLPSTGTPDGQVIRFAAGLSGLTGRRRVLARVVAVVWLAAIGLSLVAALAQW
ncbi:hypothetical protein CLV35_3936 [Motilibacter peucedani]|uniref:Uncharacterized protein n=1 Tax=Motilibacter peucedani TaxID=598650 RepID=A0A420XK10_9ACTN|nr:hypothetical protein [Motilibacter peucedani]RKS68029.1 hypothetical protein CLV35_3936 [Motilibacter peucedani]